MTAKFLYTFTTSDSGKKITVNQVNLPVSKVWLDWDSSEWTSHYIYPFFDMSDKKLMPVYAIYELQYDCFSEGIILAISPQVRKGSVRSIAVPHKDYDGTISTIHYTFTVTKNKITVEGGNNTESIQFNIDGYVTSITSPFSNIKFAFNNNILSKIDFRDTYVLEQDINSDGEITHIQTGGVGYSCNASYKYDPNGILKECVFAGGGGNSSGGCSISNDKTYQVQNGVLAGIVFNASLKTYQSVTNNYNLNLTEQYIYD
ncbi:MAG: hypothetical protein ACI4F1_10225 [Bariatricus sp.]